MMSQTRFELSVIIPAYNEEQRIAPTLETTASFLARWGICSEIVVVDDGSTDGTVALVRRLARELSGLCRIRCIECLPNRGKGHAVRRGMLGARGAIRLMCDADGSMPPTEIPKLVGAVRGGAQVAIGSRYVSGAQVDAPQPWYRVAWSRLANAVIQRTLVPGVLDTQCGFKAFTAEAAREVFRRARIDGWSFDLEVLALAKRLGYTVVEIPVTWSDDERSRINPLRDALRGVRELLAIRRNFRRQVYGALAPAAGPGPLLLG